MNPLRSLLLRSTAGIWNRRRSRLFANRKKQLKNDDFTILSCNCIAGVVYHDFGLPFRTPIVNLFLTCEDFIRFCEDPKHYLSAEFLPYTGEIRKKYPLADLDGLTLHLVHYSTFDSAKEAWERRKQRVNFGHIFLVGTNRNGFNEALSNRFDKLPYPKVLFVHREDDNPNHYYIKGFENDNQVGNILDRDGLLSGKRVMDQFDWVKFLNQEI